MRGSEFVFVSVQLVRYKCHKANFRRGGSYIDSPDLIRKKKATINPKNKNGKCFQYVVTIPLNYKEVKWNPERFTNIKPFINNYNYKKNYLHH